MICDRKVFCFPGTEIEPELICPDCKEPLTAHPKVNDFNVPPRHGYVMTDERFKEYQK